MRASMNLGVPERLPVPLSHRFCALPPLPLSEPPPVHAYYGVSLSRPQLEMTERLRDGTLADRALQRVAEVLYARYGLNDGKRLDVRV